MKQSFKSIDRLSITSRFIISLIAGFFVFLLTYRRQDASFTFLVSWIGFAVTSLSFSWETILARHPQKTATVAQNQDSGYIVMFTVAVSAAFISLFAIILLLHDLPTYSRKGLNIHIVLSIVSVAFSWILIHTLFTIRYAHLYYSYPSIEKKEKELYNKGLDFPGTELPDFLDFAYFSFVIGMTSQVSDVNITGRTFRRLALIHGMLAFVYNTTIIALSINIISGLIGKQSNSQ